MKKENWRKNKNYFCGIEPTTLCLQMIYLLLKRVRVLASYKLILTENTERESERVRVSSFEEETVQEENIGRK